MSPLMFKTKKNFCSPEDQGARRRRRESNRSGTSVERRNNNLRCGGN